MTKFELKKLYKEIENEYYNTFDRGHDKKHLKEVYDNTLMLCNKIGLNERDTYVALIAAIYHDTGIKRGRKYHHIHSFNIVFEDNRLKNLLSKKEILTVAYACKYHRSISKNKHRSLISKIVADADNLAKVERHIERSIYFNLHYNGKNNMYKNVYKHVKNKFGRNGYAEYLLRETRELPILERNYEIIEDEKKFKEVYDKVANKILG